MTTIADAAVPHAGPHAQARTNTESGPMPLARSLDCPLRREWRHNVQWRMRQRIFLAQNWRMRSHETTSLHEWIDAFAEPSEIAEQHGGSVSTPPQRVDRGCHTNDGRP